MSDRESTFSNFLSPGDIILTRGRGPLDFMIRLAQGLARGTLRPSPFSHAAICTGPGLVMDADIGKSLGTRVLDNWITGVSHDQSIVFRRPGLVSLPLSSAKTTAGGLDQLLQERDQNLARSFEIVSIAAAYVGRRYNLAFLKRKASHRRDAFCSEFVCTALAKLDKTSFSTVPEKTLPIDLLKLLRDAGWRELRLSDLERTTTPPPLPINWKEFGERIPGELKQDCPTILDLVNDLENIPRPNWYEIRQEQDQQAQIMIESEANRVEVAEMADTFTSAISQQCIWGAQMLVESKSQEELRAALDTIRYPVDLLDSLQALERLPSRIAKPQTIDSRSHEIMIQAFASMSKLGAFANSFEQVRFGLILEDLTAFQAILESFAEHRLRALAEQQMRELFEKRPHLADFDEDFRTQFDAKLENCRSALQEASPERQQIFSNLFGVLAAVQSALHRMPPAG